MPQTTYSYSAAIDNTYYLIGVINANGVLDSAGVTIVSYWSLVPNQIDIVLSDALGTSDKATLDGIIGSYMAAIIYNLADFSNGFDLTQFRTEIEADVDITANILFMDIVSGTININFDAELTSTEQTALDAIVSGFVEQTTSIITTNGYISLDSSLADNQAVSISASDTNGGIDINAGLGGITIDSTNAISIDAGAASNFTTTAGSLTLDATTGLVNIDGGSGINIGTQAEAQPINIGTGAAARTITLGNSTGATALNLVSGTGGATIDSTGGVSIDASGASSNVSLATTGAGQDLTIGLTGSTDSSIILSSAGTGSDAIRLNAIGGIDIDTSSSFTMDSGAFSIDGYGAASNIALATTGDAQDFTIAVYGTTDSSLVLSSSGTGADAIILYSSGGIDTDAVGSINLTSGSSATDAIRLSASSGGIDVDIGTSGFDLDTSGDINLATSKAAGGAVTLDASSGGVTISGGSFGIGINSGTGLIGIGHWSAGDIQIGNSATARTITLGNSTGATALNLVSGTGGATIDSTGTVSIDASGASSNVSLATTGAGQDLTIGLTGATDSSIVVSSTGTGTDAIRLNASAGGIDTDAAGSINLTSSSSATDAIRLSASSGGIDVDIGSSGLDLDTSGIINLATSSTSSAAIGLEANSGGINIAGGSQGIAINTSGWLGLNTWSSGPVFIGTSASAKVVTIGNTTGASGLALRHGTNGMTTYQPAHSAIGAGNQTITIAQLLTRILSGTPTIGATLTLPTAALAVAGISGIAVSDSIDFTVINKAALFTYSVAAGSGGTLEGSGTVQVNSAVTFRLRFTNVTSSSEAYTVYRIG